VFSKDFVNGLNRTDGASLFRNGEYESELISSDLDVDRFFHTTVYDSNTNELIVKLYYEYLEEGNKYESNVSYYFNFNDCKLLLKRVLVIN